MTVTAIDLISQRVATAVASYGTLLKDKLKTSLIDPSGAANFTSAQADAFVEQYDLLDQLPNVPFNGFSAAVFLDKRSGKHVIARRGTEMTSVGRVLLDLLVTDGLSIAGNGFANNQAVEMICNCKRLNIKGITDVPITGTNSGDSLFIGFWGSSITTIRVGDWTTGDSDRRQFAFGGPGVEPLNGANKSDRLCGGAGALVGWAGKDFSWTTASVAGSAWGRWRASQIGRDPRAHGANEEHFTVAA